MNTSMLYILISLKNAALAKKRFVKVVINKKSISLIQLLYKKGLIQSIQVLKQEKKNDRVETFAALHLRYYYNCSLLEKLKIISSFTKVKILQLKDVVRISESNNLLFFSTPQGLKTLSECKKQKTGGIVLFKC
jgi:ribosomal protein S8